MHTVILLDFYRCFLYVCWFLLLTIQAFQYWTYNTAYRCHAAVSSLYGPVHEGEHKGITPYHYILNYTCIFNLLGVIFYTPVCEEVCMM